MNEKEGGEIGILHREGRREFKKAAAARGKVLRQEETTRKNDKKKER